MNRIRRKSSLHVTFNMIQDAEIVETLEPVELEQLVAYFGTYIQRVSLLPLSDIPTDAMFLTFDDYYYLVRDLILQDLLSLLLRVCCNVKELTLSYGRDYETYPEQWLASFVKKNERLRALGIVGSTDGFLDGELEEIPITLEELSLDSVQYRTDENLCWVSIFEDMVYKITKKNMFQFLRRASNLEKLELTRCNMVTSQLLETMTECCTSLRVLHLYRYSEPILPAMGNIAKLENLNELYIGEFRDALVDEIFIEIGLGCRNMKKLCLFGEFQMILAL